MLTVPRSVLALVMSALCVAGCSSTTSHSTPASRSSVPVTQPAAPTTASASASAAVPRFSHIVIVVLENHPIEAIIGNRSAPFLNTLAASGAVMTQSYAIRHPSEPNYLAMFSGSTQGLTDDSCPHTYSGPNLASALVAGGQSFRGYSEGLPRVGYTGCSSGKYARKHNPWADFSNVAAGANQPMTAFPSDFAQLPNVAFVVPNLDNDMHDGTVAQSDSWLRTHLSSYATWAAQHNSLLIVTADEDDYRGNNHIATVITGAHVRPGSYAQRIDHYSLLATVLTSYGLARFGNAARASVISTIWTSS